MKINSDNQTHMIGFAIFAALALSFVNSINGFMLSRLYTALLDGIRFDFSFANFIANLGTYLRGAGIFLIVRAITLSRKRLPYSAAMLTGISCYIIPATIQSVATVLYRYYIFF